MRVLAVDTSSPRGSLAVAGPEGILAEARVVTAEGHSRWLLPAVAALLRGLGIEAGSVDVFAVTTRASARTPSGPTTATLPRGELVSTASTRTS